MPSPRLLLVHGAFHGAWCWERLTPELERLGITHQTLELPFTSTEDDVAAVRNALDCSDEDITVVGHSFGGTVISAAAADGGKPYGAVTSLVYLAAFMTAPGQSVDFSGAPGIAKIQFGEATASIDAGAARSVFYHRCAAEDADWAAVHLRAMPTPVLTAPEPASPAWMYVPSTYIICTDDQILSVAAQEDMAANANRTMRIDSDHSPFLSCPATLADVLSDVISNG